MIDRGVTVRLAEKARAIGFDLCGVAPAGEFDELSEFPEWLARGYAGEMRYLHDARRRSPRDAMPGARSVIVCAMNYNAPLPYSSAVFAENANTTGNEHASVPRAWISRYAWGDDYHNVLKRKLEELVAWLRAERGQDFQARSYTDTGPVLERVAAKSAGLGWLAKNTCLINQQLGSWLFLGVILTDLPLTPTLAGAAAPPDLCGTCTRCIDACPTDALVEPYLLDARRCISYLTIELRGSIPEEFRTAMGSMAFGCDICQDVCPWNRKAPAIALAEFQPRRISGGADGMQGAAVSAVEDESLYLPALEWLISLSEEEFRRVFRGSPVKRAKWRGLLRNACIAAGNSCATPKSASYHRIIERLEELARSEDALLAEHAAWALAHLRGASGHQQSHSPLGRARISVSLEDK